MLSDVNALGGVTITLYKHCLISYFFTLGRCILVYKKENPCTACVCVCVHELKDAFVGFFSEVKALFSLALFSYNLNLYCYRVSFSSVWVFLPFSH